MVPLSNAIAATLAVRLQENAAVVAGPALFCSLIQYLLASLLAARELLLILPTIFVNIALPVVFVSVLDRIVVVVGRHSHLAQSRLPRPPLRQVPG